jgi:circadian clock protein KaiC
MDEKDSEVSKRMPTGILGLDEIADGGLPRQGVTVVLGGAGAGKTILAMQVLATAARERGEAGIVVAFEESAERILENTSGFSWGNRALQEKGCIHILDARLSQSVEQGGEFDLVGLLAILSAKAKEVGARCVVFDGIDMLLDSLVNPALVRRELFRVREWVQTNGLSAIVTAKMYRATELGASEYDFLQFMADCVVSLHHRVAKSTALRSLRVAKYRGVAHSANEFPMAITRAGLEIAVAPREATYPASTERVSTGVERLDAMLSGGYYRGSSVLITGAPGTGKSSLAMAFAGAAARRGERALFITFDESPDQILRNATSIGIDLAAHVEAGNLAIHSLRGRAENPANHVARIRALVQSFRPRKLVVDPLSALEHAASEADAEGAALQVIDLAKNAGITMLCTSLLGNALPLSEQTPLNISTIADTWLHVSYVSQGGERNRALTIIKARGTGHSNQVRELVLSDAGVTLADVYSAGGEVLMGTLRWEKENEVRRARATALSAAALREEKSKLALAEMDAQLATLTRARAIRKAELEQLETAAAAEEAHLTEEADELLHRRRADPTPPGAVLAAKHVSEPPR